VTFNDAAAQIQGGAGVDTLVVNADAAISAVDYSLAAGVTQIATGGLNSLGQAARVYGFENLDASKASGAITVTAVAATTTSLTTGNSDDTITTMAAATGTVTVLTNEGIDTITTGASAGKFSIDGGAGDDIINASAATGTGNTLLGGAGDDTISTGTKQPR